MLGYLNGVFHDGEQETNFPVYPCFHFLEFVLSRDVIGKDSFPVLCKQFFLEDHWESFGKVEHLSGYTWVAIFNAS